MPKNGSELIRPGDYPASAIGKDTISRTRAPSDQSHLSFKWKTMRMCRIVNWNVSVSISSTSPRADDNWTSRNARFMYRQLELARMLLVLKLINCRRVCLSASLPLSLTLFGKRVDRKKRAVVEARLASSSSPAAASVEKPFHRAMHVMCWRCAPPSPPLGSNGYVNFSR